MSIASVSIERSTITMMFTVLIVVGGWLSYQNLGRLEDPEFTLKDAKVITRYPGATAAEVAEQVTDKLETAIQQMGQLDEIKSMSQAGLSTITVTIKDRYNKSSLPQVWDELRRKVSDVQSQLPPGTLPTVVYDDFGDVFGVFYAVYGDGYTYKELHEHAKMLRRELLLCDDVARVSLSGVQTEVIYLQASIERMAQFGIDPRAIQATLEGQNQIAPAGRVRVGDQFVRIEPTGKFASLDDLRSLLIIQPDGSATKLRLSDVFDIERGYADPPDMIMRYNGHPAIGLGISTVEGGNVAVLGRSVDQRLAELVEQTPVGIELGSIAHQAESVEVAIKGFMIGLIESVAIVVGVLMIAMGLRSGLLIGLILILTVLATFIVMDYRNVLLERISLGALIIALGMLVDNAIVIVEGILVGAKTGKTKKQAAIEICDQTMWPLFGATVVAVLAFAAIGVSQDSTGEYCRSLFTVILISLTLSWVLGITVTPLLGIWMLKVAPDKPGEKPEDPYGGMLFRIYRSLLAACMKQSVLFVIIMVGLLAVSVYGFGFVKQSFFPDSTRPQFLVHFWMPQGTHINRTHEALQAVADKLLKADDPRLATLIDPDTKSNQITEISSFVGGGAMRFLLTYTPEDTNSAYGLLLVSVSDYRKIQSELMPAVTAFFNEEVPDAQVFCRAFVLGPGEPQKIHARLRGPDPAVLRVAAEKVFAIMESEPQAVDVMDDWRQRTAVIQPRIAEAQARNLGITRGNIAEALQSAMEGRNVGLFRERDEVLPIKFRLPLEDRRRPEQLHDVQIWSPVASGFIPIDQVIVDSPVDTQDAIVRRFNRVPCLTIKCDPAAGLTAEPVRQQLAQEIQSAIESGRIDLPTDKGYTLEWGGEYEDSAKAQASLFGKFPLVVVLMIATLILLFNCLRQPLAIMLTVPLAVVGVTVGLLLLDQPFGFMALLGFMSLMGMLIKNAIVLIDEINAQIVTGKPRFTAILDSGTSRLRPVSMAALTTVLGMIPLLADAFFVAMAVTIMFGLTFATVLTLIVVPVLYGMLYRVKSDEVQPAGS